MKSLSLVPLALLACLLVSGGAVAQSFQSYGTSSSVNSVVLDGSGSPTVGSWISLTSFNTPASAQGYLLASPNTASVPYLGGTVYVDPAIISITSIVAESSGYHSAVGQLPSDPAIAGLVIHLQTVFLDSGQPEGVVFSNGLTMSIGAAP